MCHQCEGLDEDGVDSGGESEYVPSEERFMLAVKAPDSIVKYLADVCVPT